MEKSDEKNGQLTRAGRPGGIAAAVAENPWTPYVLVSLAVLAAYWPLLGGWTLFTSDAVPYQIPEKTVIRECLLAGRLPLINPYILCGSPILPNIATGALYPLNALLLVGSNIYGFNLFVFVHIALAGLAATLLLERGIRVHPMAAALGGASFALSGPILGAADKGFIASAWLIPLFLLGVILSERSVERGKAGKRRLLPSPAPALLAVASLTLLLLSGNFMEAYVAVAATGIGALANAWTGSRRPVADTLKTLLRYSILAAFATALAAPQIIPTVMAAKISYRAGGIPLGEAAKWSFPPVRTIEHLVPHFFGTRGGTPGFSFPEGAYAKSGFLQHGDAPWFDSVFVSVPILCGCVLALLAAAWRPRNKNDGDASLKPTLFPLAAVVFFILMAYGKRFPLYAACHAALPGFNVFRHPEKFIEFANLGLVILGVWGLDSALANPKRGLEHLKKAAFILAWTCAIVLAAVAVPAFLKTAPPDAKLLAEWRGAMACATLLSIGLAACSALFLKNKANVLAALFAIALGHSLFLLHAVHWAIPSRRLETAFANNWVSKAAPKLDKSLWRVYADPRFTLHLETPGDTTSKLEKAVLDSAASLACNACAVEKIKTPGGFSALMEKKYLDFISFRRHPANILMDILSVKIVAVPSGRSGHSYMWNNDARPRIETLTEFDTAESAEQAKKMVFGRKAEGKYRLVLSDLPKGWSPPDEPGRAPSVEILEDSPGLLIAKVKGGPAWLVFRDWKTPGWKCVDAGGKRKHIATADTGLMAVFADGKNTALAFAYSPPGLKTGVITALLALAALVAAATIAILSKIIAHPSRKKDA